MRIISIPSPTLRASVPLRLCVKNEERRATRSASISLLLLTTLALLTAPGCQSLMPDWSKYSFGFNTPRVQESKFAVPARMAVLWSPAVLNQAGQTPTRGFGGRVYFYDSKNTPITVEGQLVVYAYNNDKPNQDSKVPDRKFAFTPEQFTKHYTPTELGASYSIWIPWDAVGGVQTEISLVPVFNSSSGALVMGQPSRNLLPGSSTAPTQAFVTNCTLSPLSLAERPGPGVPPLPGDGMNLGAGQMRYDPALQQASFSQPTNPSPPNSAAPLSSGLSTMSITLPGTMADRLAQAPPQVSTLQRLAQLRQEALARQSGYVPPPLPGALGATAAPAIPTTATAAPAAGAVPPPWFPGSPQPIRSSLPAPQAPASPNLPQVAGPPPLQQSHATQPSAPPAWLR